MNHQYPTLNEILSSSLKDIDINALKKAFKVLGRRVYMFEALDGDTGKPLTKKNKKSRCIDLSKLKPFPLTIADLGDPGWSGPGESRITNELRIKLQPFFLRKIERVFINDRDHHYLGVSIILEDSEDLDDYERDPFILISPLDHGRVEYDVIVFGDLMDFFEDPDNYKGDGEYIKEFIDHMGGLPNKNKD